MNLVDLDRRLAHIEALLQRLVEPVEVEEARQLLLATPEQVKAHNKAVLANARKLQKRRAAWLWDI